MSKREWNGKPMELTKDTLARIVQNSHRANTCGTMWPGCTGCNHLYMHSDSCHFYMKATDSL